MDQVMVEAINNFFKKNKKNKLAMAIYLANAVGTNFFYFFKNQK